MTSKEGEESPEGNGHWPQRKMRGKEDQERENIIKKPHNKI